MSWSKDTPDSVPTNGYMNLDSIWGKRSERTPCTLAFIISTEALEASKVGLFSKAISRALSRVSIPLVCWDSPNYVKYPYDIWRLCSHTILREKMPVLRF